MVWQRAHWIAVGLLCMLVPLSLSRGAEQVTAQALVERHDVYVGAPFLLQLRIDGSEAPERPDLSHITGFSVEELGGTQNSSQSVTIVNGRMNRVIQRGYIFNYRLTAKSPGKFTIPAITVTAEGQTIQTRPILIQAAAAAESEDFKLRISLSGSKAYLGQPVTMTVTWYVGKNVRNFAFNVPFLEDDRFDFIDPEVKPDPNRHLQIPINGGQVIGEKGSGTLDGKEYLTVRFRKIVIARRGGSVTIPQATVAGQAIAGYQRRRGGFDDFFSDDFFGLGRQPVLESFVVPSNRPTLEVLDLPPAGRPDNFSGLVGNFEIGAEAAPNDVAVGDPITLTVNVSGSGYLGRLELPPLSGQPTLARDFKIPEEMASGIVKGRAKSFTQTLRAKHSDVSEIPPIELSYFNPESASYETARTDPIPLSVEGARIVTARDAEGAGNDEPVRSGIESAEGGIAYNYEGPDVLLNQASGPGVWLRSPAWVAGLAIPPIIYLGLLGFVLYGRWRNADPVGRRSRQAFQNLKKAVKAAPEADTDEFYTHILDAVRRYLGDKLGIQAQALTFGDVRPMLVSRGVDEETVEAVRRILERCEAGRYAGAAFASEDPAGLGRAAIDSARKLEEALR